MGLLSSISFGLTDISAILTVIIVIYVTHYYYKYFTRTNPLPGPFPLPLAGNFYMFFYDDYSTVAKKCHEKYGDLFEFYFGNERQIFVGRMSAINKLFNPSSKTNFKMRNLGEFGLSEFGVSGYGVVFNHDYKSWSFNRHFFTQVMLTPSFTQICLNKTRQLAQEMTNRFNFMSENDVEFDLSKWIYCFMADVLFEVFVGRKGHASDNHYSNSTGQNLPVLTTKINYTLNI